MKRTKPKDILDAKETYDFLKGVKRTYVQVAMEKYAKERLYEELTKVSNELSKIRLLINRERTVHATYLLDEMQSEILGNIRGGYPTQEQYNEWAKEFESLEKLRPNVNEEDK